VQDWLLYDTDYNWRVLAEEGGELRAIADIGTHWLDLVQSMSDLKVSQIFADLKTIHPIRQRPVGEVETFSGPLEDRGETRPVEILTEDLGSILLRFENGARGTLFVSQATAGRKNCLRYEISGVEGALAWNSESPNQLWLGHRNRPNEILVKDPSLMTPEAAAYSAYPGGHAEGFSDTFKMCFRAF
jgi:predicted dehydrogenase